MGDRLGVRGVNGGRPSVRRRTNSLRGDDREYAKVADSVATALGSRPRWRRRNKSVAMAGRRAIVSHGTDGGGVTDGGGTASSIAAAANAAAAAIRGGGDCSGGGDTRRRRVQVGPPISSSLQGGGEPRSGFPLSLSHATWRGHIKIIFSFSKMVCAILIPPSLI